ncbi:MAG: NAD(P)H-binding protein, partial [Thermoleophilia bacterium]|nr:NAD(P)H-binding protein [Thermoleophilia bacterium]
ARFRVLGRRAAETRDVRQTRPGPAMTQCGNVLVLGGTGHYGRHIVAGLEAKGVPVRVLTRSAVRARGSLPRTVELTEGDLESREDVARALRDADRVVVAVSAFTRAQIRTMRAIERDAVIAALDEARVAGVKRVLYVSVFDIRPEIPGRLHLDSARIKLGVETYLQSSDFEWTVLGAPPSMEVFFAMIRGDRMVVPGGGPKAIPTISPVDLGEIAAQAVLRDDLGGRRIRLAGPELLSFPEAAKRLSAVCGTTIRFTAIPLILPKMAWFVTWPLARFSRSLDYVHTILGFALLLNAFPQNMALASVEDHGNLVRTFSYTPTTLEMEARRRRSPRIGRLVV